MWNSLLIHFFLIDYSYQVSADDKPRRSVWSSFCPIQGTLVTITEKYWYCNRSWAASNSSWNKDNSARQPTFKQHQAADQKNDFSNHDNYLYYLYLSFEQRKGYTMNHVLWLIWYDVTHKISVILDYVFGSVEKRYLERSWKGTFVSGHSRWLSPRFYFTWTTLERLFQTYYQCTGLAHLDCYIDFAYVHWHHTTSYYEIDLWIRTGKFIVIRIIKSPVKHFR